MWGLPAARSGSGRGKVAGAGRKKTRLTVWRAGLAEIWTPKMPAKKTLVCLERYVVVALCAVFCATCCSTRSVAAVVFCVIWHGYENT
jgi:hypothetical protein